MLGATVKTLASMRRRSSNVRATDTLYEPTCTTRSESEFKKRFSSSAPRSMGKALARSSKMPAYAARFTSSGCEPGRSGTGSTIALGPALGPSETLFE